MESLLTTIADYLWRQSWQIALLVVVVGLASWALRNRSAHVRYLLWLLVLAKCLTPPVAEVPLAVLPDKVLPVTTPVISITPPQERVRQTPVEEGLPLPPTPASALREPLRLTTQQWLAVGWLAGVAVFACVALTKAGRTILWLRHERRTLPRTARDSFDETFRSLRVKHPPRVWLIEGVGQPFVWGILRGDIYLPGSFARVQDEHRRDILGHEISHVLRFDAVVNLLQISAQGIFWFHPLAWWANQRIRREREKCCDEMAIAHLGARPKDYSTAIIRTLIQAQESTRSVPSLAIAGPVKNIEERIKTMLRPGKKFYRRPSLVAAITLLMVAFLTVPTAIVLTARAEAKAATESGDKRTNTLHEATAAGDADQVKLLLSKGADINAKDKDGRTPLHSAAWYGRKDAAQVLIAKGANVNETDVSGQTPLHLAASFRWRFVPELLLAKGANVNARDKAGNTPLHIAAGDQGPKKDFLEFLLAKGADVNARNDKGETPLHLVPRTRKQDKRRELAADALLAHGADINAKDKSGCTPLHVAAENGQGKVVELLLAKGADSKAKAADGTTTLHRAVMGGRSDVVALLLDRGVDINSAQADGWTALHYSARVGTNDIAELLISKGADVNAKTVRGETSVHLAVVQNRRDTVKLLLSKGAEVSTIQLAAYLGDLAKVKSFIEKGISVNTQDGYWPTPLQAAAAAGQREVAEFLISKGALVNAEAAAQGGTTALHYAALGGSKEVVELLISKGAVIDARDKNGLKALPPAAMVNYMGMVKLFTASEANAKDKDGWTPLHYAARSGQKDVVLLLIDHGADVNAEAPDKSKPLDHAAWSGQKDKDMVKLLIDKGTNISKDDGLFLRVPSSKLL
jgi:ankyrin repeat protein/beta-lactamase regulating signal transducer with metallopeptidase domain